ncbi:MAG: hypothetical protein JXK94_09755 [Deltaproteobacteria bacterium]|nr:hypothetical protein [Deltaproteobacteria bacterium]
MKKEGSQVWCKRMIEEGVAETLGPVDEPYLRSFPPPDLFLACFFGEIGPWPSAMPCLSLSGRGR